MLKKGFQVDAYEDLAFQWLRFTLQKFSPALKKIDFSYPKVSLG